MKKDKEPRTQLLQRIADLEAQLVHNYHFTERTLYKASIDRMMGSCVIVELRALGGRRIIEPTAIRDGLSQATIDSLRKDVIRSYNTATELNPL